MQQQNTELCRPVESIESSGRCAVARDPLAASNAADPVASSNADLKWPAAAPKPGPANRKPNKDCSCSSKTTTTATQFVTT